MNWPRPIYTPGYKLAQAIIYPGIHSGRGNIMACYTGTHFQTFGAEKIFSRRISQKVSKKVDDHFWLFHYIFVYYPPFIQHFLVFNCHFSVASLINISNKISVLTLPKRCGMQVTYSFKI